ncbi:MAG: LamG domain-containing protein [Candidatus Cloacimonetes bacterium]|nr:LamG domain-containing protein [Candidatus Cloacimonadota bacterium]
MKKYSLLILFAAIAALAIAATMVIQTTTGTDEYDLSEVLSITFSSQGPTDYIAYYPYNGNADDESGNGHHGNMFGVDLTADRFGNPGSAMEFDGIDDYIEPILKLPIDGFPLSINLWVNTPGNAPGSYQTFYTSDYNDSYALSYYGFRVMQRYDGNVRAYFAATSGHGDYATRSVYTDAPLPANEWVMLSFIFESPDNMRIYFSGDEQSTFIEGNQSLTTVRFSEALDRFGTDYRTADRPYFEGKLDDIRIYDRVLTDSEILVLLDARN